MKNAFPVLLIMIFTSFNYAQTPSYDDLWTKVDLLEAEGLPKSALKIIETIKLKAEKDNNDAQFIKTMLFKSKFALILEEDAQLNIINDFKAEITQREFPTKNILESLLANMYWQYFKQNRYQLYRRTKTEDKVDTTDFRTWDLQTLFYEIHVHFQKSLENGLMLQLEDLNKYNALLTQQKDSKLFRPTLFDFLNHLALDFYKTNETHITKPAYQFEIDNPEYLANVTTFSQLNITSKDSTSLQLQTLKIYQDLIQFHLKDKTPQALAVVDIERLKFVEQHATFPNKTSTLLHSLQYESERLKHLDASGLYQFQIASIYYEQSQQYQPKTNEDNRWKAKDAMGICNDILSKFPNSKAAEQAEILKNNILQPTLQITCERFVPIKKASRLLINYKNIDNLTFNIIKVSEHDFRTINVLFDKDEKQAYIKKIKTTKSWKSILRNDQDYQAHSTEIIVPELDNGRYVIYATTAKKDDLFAYSEFQVTNLALVESENNDYKIFQLINRNNGQPINNTTIDFQFDKHGSNKNIKKQQTTNTFGEVFLKKDKETYYTIEAKANYNNDIAYFGDYHINRYYKNNTNQDEDYKAFVFTDRSIYRPGQTVFFKAIAINTNTNTNKPGVLANESVYATLYNTNHEELSELDLVTNEFGSVSGEFILPNNGLTGDYYIEFEGNDKDFYVEQHFSVEEYKRPKFETKFNPITETFKLNDSITAKGAALAYAGSTITDAKVAYRVHRTVQFPRWYFWYRPMFYSESQEITHGESLTNDKGEFEITFKAIPGISVDKTNLPVFHYEITADVTDINGETRSATTIVKVGYHALLANMTLDNILDKNRKDYSIAIDTRNLNGEFTPASGSIKIYKLKAPDKVLRNRPWEAPDYQDISKEEFKTLFPNDAYANEHDANHWKKDELLFDKSFNTADAKSLSLGNIKKWPSGQYLVTLETTDKFGQTVKDELKTVIYSDKDKTIADNKLFSITTDKTSYQPGETAIITLASAVSPVYVTLQIEKNHDIVKTEIITLENNKKSISIPVTEKDLGGFSINYSFAAFNSYQASSVIIGVPYPKRDLNIETTSFRDKLQPGTDESWSFNIKGPKGDKVSAELLTSMYDASLDQFKPHQWTFKPLFQPYYYTQRHNQSHQSFGIKNFRIYNEINHFTYPRQYYDRLNWFGFSFNFNKWQHDNYIKSLKRNKLEYDNSIKEGIITGTVFDEDGLAIPGVNIIIEGTTRGTVTDFDGNFSIEAEASNTLIFNFIGFVEQSIRVGKYNKLKLYLFESSEHLDEVVVVGYGVQKKASLTGALSMVQAEALDAEEDLTEVAFAKVHNAESPAKNSKKTPNFDAIQIRKNLQETAFFFPDLQTDKDGNISFSFTTPEALTQWKLQLLAHTKTLEHATKTLTAVTQKELMVIPNAPRFLRQGDTISISAKIANITDENVSGQAILILTDAITGNDINSYLSNSENTKSFTVDAKGNTNVSWLLHIPDTVDVVQYKIIAKSETFSDGEQNALPVLSNRMLVTETLPMWVRSNETRTFTLDKLKTNTSKTLKNHKLTLEITSNPAWYAVQALPYLMEYPYECNEQTFSRFYANALASHIANSNPRIQDVFNQWKTQDVLLSNLEKNEALKSILIQETPWLRDAQSETEQKKRLGLLFDLNKMNNELGSAIRKLKQNQMPSGAWPWFNGGRDSRYITQHIITGFGHLKQLGVTTNPDNDHMIKKAIDYLDAQFIQEYKDIRKYDSKADLNNDHLSYTQLHYLYMRSFFPEIQKSKNVKEVIDYYQTQIQKYWLNRSLYAKGLMALISFRSNDKTTADKILKSLKENSITTDELGMYWKTNTNSWFWYQAPIETQSLLIEAFTEIENDTKTIDNLKIWLLKNKQTNRWKTTKATTDAVYALLLQGSDWLSVTDMVDVTVSGNKIEPSQLENLTLEAGTGYYETSWDSSEIKPEMAEVTLTKKGNGIAWGGLYWQYFEDLDKVTSAETPLQLKKKLFLKTNTDTGEQLSEITEHTHLKVGDLVRVRIELRSDRTMEFVHMKDMRAAGLEPVNVLSQYKWQDGLGYYEATKDALTNFFFDYLPKGVYVFEYDLRVNNAGNMSNGITTIQSMYAPEFSSHSNGVRIHIN
ncbi:alpha-2-macroglobulin family protein [Aestuariibaculum suncheonense]|uniref:Carboxypeptidase-like regulatory domain-containing protein n=1 Tax=Aestuariibaculum suncheonense TaxID=1028745 RepID=A0A8J6U9L5_9FLAO|nr:MG2 domain-containing protein [Aestuariibaculum suncheonense]MBD0834298.1 carboxypeptidase-like regulatory domain-containing protein [Aestuariibaculum suncheonense]